MLRHFSILLLLCVSAFGQITNINFGTTPDDRTGDNLRKAGSKINTNIAWLASQLGSATNTVANKADRLRGMQVLSAEAGLYGADPTNGYVARVFTGTASSDWNWNATEGGSDVSGERIRPTNYVTGSWIRTTSWATSKSLGSLKGAVLNSSGDIVASTATKQQVDNAKMQVEHVAAMLALTSNLNNGQLIETGGYWSSGDGGSAVYRYDSASAAATNVASSFAGPGGTGRFLLLPQREINVRVCGAKGDGTSNDGPYIQAAIDYAVANQIADVVFPEGTFVTAQTIEHKAPCNLIGAGTVYASQDSRVGGNSAYATAGKSCIKLASGANVPLINANTTGRVIQTTVSTDDGVTSVAKRIHGGIIRGLVLDGNGSNQTKYDCDLIRVLYAWGYTIEDCNFFRASGYAVWTRECNVVQVLNCKGGGDLWDRSKGILFWSAADSKVIGCDIGGVCGPVLQISGVGGWQNVVEGNFFFNSVVYRRTVSGVSTNTVTFSADHCYETGSPIEFVPASGGSISPELTIGRPYWAIRVSSTQVRVAASYEDALAGTALAITAGSGTYYGWHGYSSGVDITWTASKNSITGNRLDQHEQHGISLYAANQNTIVGNLCNFNQYNTQSNSAAAESAAGIAILGGCTGNVIGYNDVSNRTPLYPQDYGIFETGANTANIIGPNSSQGNTIAKYSFASASTRLLDWGDATSASIAKTGPFNNSGNYSIAIGSSSITTVSSTGLAVTGGVSATGALSGATAAIGSTGGGTVLDVTGGTGGVALQRWIRSGQNTVGILLSNGWIVSDETNVKRLFTAAWDGSAPRITFGSASASAPVGTTIQGEVATGSNVAGSFLSLRSGTGTGNASVASATISFQTPDAGSSGSTVQTHVTRASVGDFGLNLGSANTGTPVKRIRHGRATLVAGGTVTILDAYVTTSTRIIATVTTPSGTQGILTAPTASRVASTSFAVISSNSADRSEFDWIAFEP